jgi:hypothetical protein
MSATKLLGIQDVHSESGPREEAKRILMAGGIAYYFMEFTNTAIGGPEGKTKLNDLFAQLVKDRASTQTATRALQDGGYFRRLPLTDASPSIVELAAIAINKGTRVLAADADYKAIVEKLKTHPEGNPSADERWLFQPLGLELRDRSTSNLVAHFLTEHAKPRSTSLILWGANHFEADKYRPGLHDMIQDDFKKKVAERHQGYRDHRDEYAWELIYTDCTPPAL